MNYNWCQATTSYLTILKHFISCSQSGRKCWIEKVENASLKSKGGYPIFAPESKNLSYDKKVAINRNVYVVVWNDETPKKNFLIHSLTLISNILKYIPKKSYCLDMKTYKVIRYRVGSVENGYSLDIHIPKKFSFK